MVLTINGKAVPLDKPKNIEYMQTTDKIKPVIYTAFLSAVASILVAYVFSSVAPVATIAFLYV